MVKRRSLDDALTPEQENFLAGSNAKEPAKTRKPPGKRPKPKSKPQKENVPMTKPAFKEPATQQFLPAQETYAIPTLTGLNTRIASHLSNALLRASMERRMARHPMGKVQDIVGEALADWMEKHGYLK